MVRRCSGLIRAWTCFKAFENHWSHFFRRETNYVIFSSGKYSLKYFHEVKSILFLFFLNAAITGQWFNHLVIFGNHSCCFFFFIAKQLSLIRTEILTSRRCMTSDLCHHENDLNVETWSSRWKTEFDTTTWWVNAQIINSVCYRDIKRWECCYSWHSWFLCSISASTSCPDDVFPTCCSRLFSLFHASWTDGTVTLQRVTSVEMFV